MGIRPKLRWVSALVVSMALAFTIFPGGVAHAAGNLLLGKPVSASGQETDSWGPELTVDGDPGPADTPPEVHNSPEASRWSANRDDHVWLTVDIQATARIDSVRIRWGNTYSTQYSLLGSADGQSWSSLDSGLSANSRGQWVETRLTDSPQLRYLKVESFAKSQKYPISIWEVEAYGTILESVEPPTEQSGNEITPRPAQQRKFADREPFKLGSETKIVANDSARASAEYFARQLRIATGYELPVVDSGPGIAFVLDPTAEVVGVDDEGYRLVASADGVGITAHTERGLFYGAQSLLQLFGPWSRSPEPVVEDWQVVATEIVDGPRYEWRGFMLDVARNFFTVDEVKQLIDQLAQYKLNVLHIHLTDDQGWRIAISNADKASGDSIDYELLTKVSGATAMEPTKWTDREGTTGYYSAEEFTDIVSYAADRHISVVPEIDLPGHTTAALHAIPELNTDKSLPRVLEGQATAPAQRSGDVGKSALDADSEATYAFIRHVVNEIVSNYQSPLNGDQYFHFGGDEPHDMLTTYPGDYEKFMVRVTDLIQETGATPVAWNEATKAWRQLPEGLVIQHWNGDIRDVQNYVTQKNGRVVLSPANRAYLPQIPGPGVLGPSWACGGPCTLERFYDWDPTAFSGVTEDKVLGLEAPIWGEHLRSLSSAEYLIFPRLIATAEVGWTPQQLRSKNFADFQRRLGSLGVALSVQGRNFYSEGIPWEASVRELKADTFERSATTAVARGAIPAAEGEPVSASLEVSGVSYPIEVTTQREFRSGVGTKFDDRQALGKLTFSAPNGLPRGERGVLTVQAGDRIVAQREISLLALPEPQPTPPELHATIDSSDLLPGTKHTLRVTVTAGSQGLDGAIVTPQTVSELQIAPVNAEVTLGPGQSKEIVFEVRASGGIWSGNLAVELAYGSGRKVLTQVSITTWCGPKADIVTAQASSEEENADSAGNGPVSKVLDGDPATYWNSRLSPEPVQAPHTITLDLREEKAICSLNYLARQDSAEGRAKGYLVEVSKDKVSWHRVASGEFGDHEFWQQARFTASEEGRSVNQPGNVVARYIRLTIVGNHSGQGVSAAELSISLGTQVSPVPSVSPSPVPSVSPSVEPSLSTDPTVLPRPLPQPSPEPSVSSGPPPGPTAMPTPPVRQRIKPLPGLPKTGC